MSTTDAYSELAAGLHDLADLVARGMPRPVAEPPPPRLMPPEAPFLAKLTLAIAVASPVVFTVAYHLFPPARPVLGG